MNEICIKQDVAVPVNWSIHSEQIVVDDDLEETSSHVGYKFVFTASSIVLSGKLNDAPSGRLF